MTKPIKYVAAPTHVREVTLRGTADTPYWQNRLAPYDLTPADRGGRCADINHRRQHGVHGHPLHRSKLFSRGRAATRSHSCRCGISDSRLQHQPNIRLERTYILWNAVLSRRLPLFDFCADFNPSHSARAAAASSGDAERFAGERPKSRCEAAANPGKDQYSYRRRPALSRKDATSSTGKCTAKPTFIRLTAPWT